MIKYKALAVALCLSSSLAFGSESAVRRLQAQLEPGLSIARVFELTDAVAREAERSRWQFSILIACTESSYSVRPAGATRYVLFARQLMPNASPQVRRTEHSRQEVEEFLATLNGHCDGMSVGVGTEWGVAITLGVNGTVESVSLPLRSKAPHQTPVKP